MKSTYGDRPMGPTLIPLGNRKTAMSPGRDMYNIMHGFKKVNKINLFKMSDTAVQKGKTFKIQTWAHQEPQRK